ncbi:hypothetical protein D3C87_1999580 [compost metagenome]
MPSRREAQTLVFADEQLHAEIGLQLADTGGQVRRDAMHFLRRLGDAAGLGDRIEHFKLG